MIFVLALALLVPSSNGQCNLALTSSDQCLNVKSVGVGDSEGFIVIGEGRRRTSTAGNGAFIVFFPSGDNTGGTALFTAGDGSIIFNSNFQSTSIRLNNNNFITCGTCSSQTCGTDEGGSVSGSIVTIPTSASGGDGNGIVTLTFTDNFFLEGRQLTVDGPFFQDEGVNYPCPVRIRPSDDWRNCGRALSDVEQHARVLSHGRQHRQGLDCIPKQRRPARSGHFLRGVRADDHSGREPEA